MGTLRVGVVQSNCEIQVILVLHHLSTYNTHDMMHLEQSLTEHVHQIILGEKDIAAIKENVRMLEI